jgi:hypothetical protein
MSFLDDIKDSISDFANKAADKLVPKELAPFLPILGAFAPGLGLAGTGIFNQYILPQLLTAASSAKMQGEIDPTQQAITGIMSALQGPVKQTEAEAALLKQNPELAKQVEKASKAGEVTKITDLDRISEIIEAGDLEGKRFFQDSGGLFDFLPTPGSPGMPFGVDEISSFTDPITGNTRFFRPGSSALDDFLATEITSPIDLSGLSGQEFKDAIVKGGNITDTGFDTKLGALQKELGSQQGLQALNKARGFFDSPIGFNAPTFAKVGVGSAPFLGAQAANLKAEQEALEAEEAAEAERFAGARDDLFDYFRRLSDPQGLFTAAEGGIASLPAGMPQGMQVDGRNGTFIPMGVQEKADDVPAMLSKNEFVMTADAVRAAGGGSVEKGAQRMYDLMNTLEARA